MASDPIRPDELAGLFQRFLPPHGDARIALAVSGGSDSTALMVLVADWLGQTATSTATVTVLTVDHGLRPQSAAEALAVARQAAALGFAHATLAWAGAKPETGLQAAAREARYRLMAAHMREHGVAALFTAHTADDQAETLLMRLARGSGLDGLSAMAPISRLEAGGEFGLSVVRPLLDVPKARLQATLRQRGIAWIEDPSNQSPAFERVRLRAVREGLAALGLSNEKLALSARRLARARLAIDHAVAAFCDPVGGHVHTDPCGFLRISAAALRQAPLEIAVRVLVRAIAAAGGSPAPVPLAGVEDIAQALRWPAAAGAWTLARAAIVAAPDGVLVEREPGREPLPRLVPVSGGRVLWDGRFRIVAGPALETGLEVAGLGADGSREVRQALANARDVPPRALAAVPAIWRGLDLVAVPSLDFCSAGNARPDLSVAFAGFDRYNPAATPGPPDEVELS
jgi:tRNA(Ile)-lysidine synthase